MGAVRERQGRVEQLPEVVQVRVAAQVAERDRVLVCREQQREARAVGGAAARREHYPHLVRAASASREIHGYTVSVLYITELQ